MNNAGIGKSVRGTDTDGPWPTVGNRVPTWVGVVAASVALSIAAVFGVDALGLFSSDTVESTAPTAISSASPSVSTVTPVDFAELYNQVRPSIVKISTVSPQGSGIGTGVVLDKDGHVLTNYHVISGAEPA